MPKVQLKNLSDARILVSNDDGIHAPGLKVLERVARSLSKDVWVIAPEAEQSGASHGLTLRRPLPIHSMSRPAGSLTTLIWVCSRRRPCGATLMPVTSFGATGGKLTFIRIDCGQMPV